ncbi:hypothetical protein GCM10022254_10290 [Actinomadura meridiana]|uniref:Uncharacterized protein n=1 Tax=Actinomadura meridiana TaxID=559626 RepID=A0ABP8BV72_9ACTN
MLTPDLSPEARAARAAVRLQERRLARRACWEASGGDPFRYRALMAARLGIPLETAIRLAPLTRRSHGRS